MTNSQAHRVLYELERQELVKVQGANLYEIDKNIAKACEIIRDMADGKVLSENQTKGGRQV